ncbi:MAG: hypothetical protein IPQ07_21180 [Myxococcales bacterium]|nr:hypothetical protein [Myxococcales bacterium]
MPIWWFQGRQPTHGVPAQRELTRIPITRIADVPDGTRRKISGVIVLQDEPLRSPMSQTLCCAWAIAIAEVGARESVGRGSRTRGVPFTLRDDGGEARVYPEGARLAVLGHAIEYRSAALLRGYEGELFRELGIRLNYPDSSGVRFTEHVIPPGAKVSVFGYSQREPDRARVDADVSGYRGDVPTRPVFSSTKRAPLIIG